MTTRWLLIGDPDWAPLSAFAEGLSLIGVDAFWTPINDWARQECDAVAIYGLRHQGQDVLTYYAGRGVPVVVIDHGYVKRVNISTDLPTGYLQVGINRLGWVPKQAPSRDRVEALDVTPRVREPKQIRRAVIMGQVPYDASHRLNAQQLTRCYEALFDELRQAGIPNVVFRGHPLANESLSGSGVNPSIPRDGMRPIDDAIRNADLVVSINSNSGLEAIIDGCPAIVLKPSHYTEAAYRWPVLTNLIEPAPIELVNDLLARIAYAQWTDAEIRAGLPHRFLQSIGAIP